MTIALATTALVMFVLFVAYVYLFFALLARFWGWPWRSWARSFHLPRRSGCSEGGRT